MKLSTITSIAAMLASAQAVIVYQTEHYHVTVTAGGSGQVASVDAQPAPAPTSEAAPPPPPPAPTTEAAADESADQGAIQQNANVDLHTVFADAQGKVLSAGADQVSAPQIDVPSQSTTQQEAPSPTPQAETSSPAPSPSSAQSSSAATTSSSSGSDDEDIGDYAKKCIDHHNSDRSKHSAPAMQWNQTLADYAKDYLQNQNCVFAHSGGPYGENIAMGYKNPEDAIAAWYKEKESYNFLSGLFSEDTGHFTQMVWKKSVQLGCAQVSCSNGDFFACEYFPRGNVVSQFLDNVFSG